MLLPFPNWSKVSSKSNAPWIWCRCRCWVWFWCWCWCCSCSADPKQPGCQTSWQLRRQRRFHTYSYSSGLLCRLGLGLGLGLRLVLGQDFSCDWRRCCWDFAAISNTNCSVFMATNAFCHFFTHGSTASLLRSVCFWCCRQRKFEQGPQRPQHSGSIRTDFVLTFSATLIPNTQMQSRVCRGCARPAPGPLLIRSWRRSPKGQGHGPGIYGE